MAFCEMTPAEMYFYIDSYNNSIWDRIINEQNFDDLVEDFKDTGIAANEIGQIIIDSYQNSIPYFIPSDSETNIDYNAFWHLIKENDLFLSCPQFRNTVQSVNKEHFRAFMANMAQKSKKSYQDLYTDFATVYTDYPDNQKNRELTALDIEYRTNIIADYKKDIDTLFAEHTAFMSEQPLSIDAYSKGTSIYSTPLLHLIQKRERFSLTYTADLISSEQSHETGEMFSTLLSELNKTKPKNYATIFNDWIAKHKATIMKYTYLDFPFRIEQTARTIATPKPADMNYAAYTIDKNKSYAQSLDTKLHYFMRILSKKHSDSLIDKYNAIIRTSDYMFYDYNYGSLVALLIFLYLGLPAQQLQTFMALFGLAFGVGPKNICSSSQIQEVYIKYLIDNGVSYQAIMNII